MSINKLGIASESQSVAVYRPVNLNELAAYLAVLPDGTQKEPNTITFASLNVSNNWGVVNTTLADAKKYVVLDLSACTATGNTISGQFNNVIENNIYIRGN